MTWEMLLNLSIFSIEDLQQIIVGGLSWWMGTSTVVLTFD